MSIRFILKKLYALFAVNILITVFFSASAFAIQKTYNFTTTSLYYNELGSQYFDLSDSVSGTFTYDPDVIATGIVPVGSTQTLDNSVYYDSSFANLSGTIKGENFSDSIGTTIVQNDTYQGTRDLFSFNTGFEAINGLPYDFSGFSTGDYTLVNVRMWWIEDKFPSVLDFLESNELLKEVPPEGGELALGFVPNDLYQSGTWDFTDQLIVTFTMNVQPVVTQVPSPTPSTSTGVPIMNGWWLLVALGGGLALLRRRSKLN